MRARPRRDIVVVMQRFWMMLRSIEPTLFLLAAMGCFAVSWHLLGAVFLAVAAAFLVVEVWERRARSRARRGGS